MKYLASLIQRWMQVFEPYIDGIETQSTRDIAKMMMPICMALLVAFFISLPFTLAAQILDTLAKIVMSTSG